MEANLRIENEEIFGELEKAPAIALHLLREAIDDIADQVEAQAKRNAPRGETGALKEHPVDRDDLGAGQAELRVPSFGGGFSVRGSGGRFIAGGVQPGRLVARSLLTVAEEPRYAKWVHDGTGIFGPRKSPIRPRKASVMIFEAYGKKFRLKEVKGQRPQPYLKEAFELVENTYAFGRFEQLKQEIQLLT